MGARSRDERKTVRYWTQVALKRLISNAKTDEGGLLKILQPILSSRGLYINSVVAETVWNIVRRFSPGQLGVIVSQGLGMRVSGLGTTIAKRAPDLKTELQVFLGFDVPSLRWDGKSILRELARMVIIADMYDVLRDAARYPQCNCMSIGHPKRGSSPTHHARYCPVYRQYKTMTCNCGAGLNAHARDHSASCPSYL